MNSAIVEAEVETSIIEEDDEEEAENEEFFRKNFDGKFSQLV